MRDTQLEERIGQVLADLSRLSEVAASAPAVTSSRDADEELPRGVNPSLRPTKAGRPPSKDRSLYDYYAWHFARARNDQARRVMLYLAEADLAARRYPAPVTKTALGAAHGTGTSEQRDERILSWYPGVHPLEAALLESTHGGYCSEENVRAVRRRARRDPDTGQPLEGWAGWSDEERTKRYHQAKREGKGLDRMASEFVAPKSTIQRFVERLRKRAA